MSKNEKLKEKIIKLSKDVTFEELTKFLKIYGYKLETKGKTSGSRVVFVDSKCSKICLHKPHPSNVVKVVYLEEILIKLIKEEKL